MDRLKEIINLLNLNKIKSINVMDGQMNGDTKIMQFYKGVREGRFSNDTEAREYLYPDSSDNNAYYKLKHTLRERLYNTLFFIDAKTSKNSDIHNAHLNIHKITSLTQILIMKNLKKNAVYMAKKGMKIAEQYELTMERLNLARILRFYDATLSGNQKKIEEYDLIVNESTALLQSEIKVEGMFFQMLGFYVNDKSTKPFIYGQASECLEKLENFIPNNPSANWFYHYTMIRIVKYMSINDYTKTLEICEEALRKIQSLPFKHTKSIANLSSQAIACCIQLRLYEKGEYYIGLSLEIIPEGMFNWFKCKELHLTLCLHTQSYTRAWDIFHESVNHKKFKKIQMNFKETWKIYEAWLHFCKKAGKIPSDKTGEGRQFRVSRYANDVPIFSRDKKGLNIPILISQIALLLQQKKYDAILDRMDAIAKYKDRYLDKEYNYRSNIFVRMLLAIPKAHFKRKLVVEKTEKERIALSELSIDMANQSMEIEIIPYEEVWEMLLDNLK